jgi:hypothetical protein
LTGPVIAARAFRRNAALHVFGDLLPLNAWQRTVVDEAGNVMPLAEITVRDQVTSSLVQVYEDYDGTTPLGNPCAADAEGFIRFYADSGRYQITAELGGVERVWEDEQIGVYFGPTAAEAAPADYSKPHGELVRQKRNTTPGTTAMSAGLNTAIGAATASNAEIKMRDIVGVEETVCIPPDAQQNLGFIGDGRTSTIITALEEDVSASPHNVNALFFNRNNNGHLRFEKLRAHSIGVAFTGKFFNSHEGGGDDFTGQASFSMTVVDFWLSFGSTNSGGFEGGFANLMVARLVAEGTKTGVFIPHGGGNHDQQFIGNVMNFCYDSFWYGAVDTAVKVTILIDGLHAYQHLRGPLVEVKNAIGFKFKNASVEADIANVGTVGLGKFTDSVDIDLDGLQMTTENGSPRGALGLVFVGACKGRISNCNITAEVGIQMSGTGAIDLTFVNCDIIGCGHAYQYLSGSQSGKLRFINCRLNNSDEYGTLHQAGTPSFDMEFIDCEIMNAGMTGITTSRNINIDTSGDVRFLRCKIGADDGDADAADYVRADGSGAFVLEECTIVGTPSSEVVDSTGSQTVDFIFKRGFGGTLASASTIQLPYEGSWFPISGTTNIGSITANNMKGRTITFKFEGVLTMTDASNLKMNSNLVTAANTSWTASCDGTNWIEDARSVNG